MNTPPKPPRTPLEARERLSLMRGVNLRNNASAALTESSFETRKAYLASAFKNGQFLKDGPENRGKGQPNPMSDPAAMEGMMGAMKGNMMMMIPQTLIMSWINAFFAGYVICRFTMTTILYQANTLGFSKTAISFDDSVQVYDAIGCYDKGLGCQMGIQFVMVFPEPVRPTVRLHLHSR